jgi:hypothetical protein
MLKRTNLLACPTIVMEVYETIAWVAIGFIPTLLAMETASRLARRLRLAKGKECPANIRMIEVDKR